MIFLDVEISPGRRKMIVDRTLNAHCHHPDLQTYQIVLNDSLLPMIVDLPLSLVLPGLITFPEDLAAIAKVTPEIPQLVLI